MNVRLHTRTSRKSLLLLGAVPALILHHDSGPLLRQLPRTEAWITETLHASGHDTTEGANNIASEPLKFEQLIHMQVALNGSRARRAPQGENALKPAER